MRRIRLFSNRSGAVVIPLIPKNNIVLYHGGIMVYKGISDLCSNYICTIQTHRSIQTLIDAYSEKHIHTV